jgi:hypothetical protein
MKLVQLFLFKSIKPMYLWYINGLYYSKNGFSQEQVLVHALAGLTTGTATGLKFHEAGPIISI